MLWYAQGQIYLTGCFQTGPEGGQWSQRAAKKTGSGGRHRAPQKLQAGGGYGTLEQQTDRIQPGGKEVGTFKHTQERGGLGNHAELNQVKQWTLGLPLARRVV
jgi:hypothetical protein